MRHRKDDPPNQKKSLRTRQQELTRELILDAVGSIVSEGRIYDFSVQDIADRSGVSYASIYRHFPTREALLEGFCEFTNQAAEPELPPDPLHLEDVPDWIKSSQALFESRRDQLIPVTMALTALDLTPPSQARRDKLLQELVARDAPHLSTAQVRQVAAVLRYLASSHTWATLSTRFKLSEGDVGEAMNWALNALIRDLTGKDHEEGDQA